MSFIKKAEEALTGFKEGVTSKSSNHGPHDSNMANKLDPRVDSDKDNRVRHEALGGTAGPHNSDLANKADPRIDSDRDNRGLRSNQPTSTQYSTTTQPQTAGPHSSNLANKADPRVDSDRDTYAVGSNQASYVPSGEHHATHATHPTGTTGPHDSNLANKLDPRVDSDRDNRARHEAFGTTGPHQSNLANKADPRFDSDLDNRGLSSHQPGHTTAGTTTAGPYSSNLANKADPRFDSDLDNRGLSSHQPSHTTAGTTTPGPHNSNIANKVDPRVDSNAFDRPADSYSAGNFHQRSATGAYNTAPTSNIKQPRADNDMIDARVDSNIGNRGVPTDSSQFNTVPSHVDNTLGNTAPLASHPGDHSTTGYPSNYPNVGTTHDAPTTAQGSYRTSGADAPHGMHHQVPAGSSYNEPRSQGTTGPHKSNILNKLDPRVDSSNRETSQRTYP